MVAGTMKTELTASSDSLSLDGQALLLDATP